MCHCLPFPLSLKDDVQPVPSAPILSLHPQGVCVLYFSAVLPFFFFPRCSSSLMPNFVMYAPHAFDPRCSPMLCTLRNRPLLSPEVYFNTISLSISPSHTRSSFCDTIFLFLLWQQSRSSLCPPPNPHPSSLSQALKVDLLALLCLCISLFLSLFLLSFQWFFSLLFLYFPPSLSPVSTHLPLPASCSPHSQWSH